MRIYNTGTEKNIHTGDVTRSINNTAGYAQKTNMRYQNWDEQGIIIAQESTA